MPRDIPVSNGSLLVAFDLDYHIRDIFFPWVGQENHVNGEAFRFGVWVDGQFSWVERPRWTIDLRYQDDTLVTEVRLVHEAAGIELRCQDAVDPLKNVFIRSINISDATGRPRDVRLFFNQNFRLYGQLTGDTAFFDPRSRSLIHYKLSRYFLTNCTAAGRSEADYFACGSGESEGKRSSAEGIERGELAPASVAWGLAESTVGVRVPVPPSGSGTAFYWIAAATGYDEVAALHQSVLERSPDAVIQGALHYWRAWVHKEPRFFGDLSQNVNDIFHRSLLVIRSQIDDRGAIIAGNDSDITRFGGDTYSYMWGRDGALVAAALARAGYPELCGKFFEFCGRALDSRGFLLQHYSPDGSVASNWHAWMVNGEDVLAIQEDSTALVLWALWIHYQCSRDIESIRALYESLIVRSADFLVSYRDQQTHLPTPSYDLWEERHALHAYTTATVVAGLRAASKFADLFGERERSLGYDAVADEITGSIQEHFYDPTLHRFARSVSPGPDGAIADQVIDVSLLGLATFGAVDVNNPRMVETAEAIRNQLTCHTAVGGVARYTGDRYQWDESVAAGAPGNPWFVATLWLAEYDIAKSTSLEELRQAASALEWCARSALPSGVLAEQVHPLTGAPLSVSPLTWSHSAFVWAVLAYADRYKAFELGAQNLRA
jgi:glucoamylase